MAVTAAGGLVKGSSQAVDQTRGTAELPASRPPAPGAHDRAARPATVRARRRGEQPSSHRLVLMVFVSVVVVVMVLVVVVLVVLVVLVLVLVVVLVAV